MAFVIQQTIVIRAVTFKSRAEYYCFRSVLRFKTRNDRGRSASPEERQEVGTVWEGWGPGNVDDE